MQFRQPRLLREAMTHSSWNNERDQASGPGYDNERLEYLGDAVLELAVGEHLFRRFPDRDEGQLTQLRAALVNTVSLARLADGLGLGDVLLLGRGAAKTGAGQLPSLLANSFEALIGAVFLDQGYRAAVRVFLDNAGDVEQWSDENFKGKLQELTQQRFAAVPSYRVTVGKEHGRERRYTAEALVDSKVIGAGDGASKQAAEQAAAKEAIARLSQQPGATHVAGASPRVAAAKAVQHAARESSRIRRRVAEIEVDRSTSRTPAGGLLGTLRAAARAVVAGRPGKSPSQSSSGHEPRVGDDQSRSRSRRRGRSDGSRREEHNG